MMAKEPMDVWMIFQVVAASEEAAVGSLKEHIEKLESEKFVDNLQVDMDDVQVVDKPHPQIEKGYSQVCEVDMEVRSFSELVELVINYGPTSVDIKSPERVTMDVGEVRDAMNAVAQMMHKFLQAGIGGMMISRSQEENSQ